MSPSKGKKKKKGREAAGGITKVWLQFAKGNDKQSFGCTKIFSFFFVQENF